MIDAENKAEARFSAFREDQRAVLDSIINKLGCLSSMVESIVQISQRVESLENENSSLRREVDCLLTSRSHEGCFNSDIIVSGLPLLPLIIPLDLIRNVFDAIDASDLRCHILEVRPIVSPSSGTTDASSNISPGKNARVSSCSFFVSLSSPAVCRAVISKKRIKRLLRQNKIDRSGSDRPVLVNEVLSKEAYSLLQRTKRIARERQYRYVW